MRLKKIGRLILKLIVVAFLLGAIVITVEMVGFLQDDAFWEILGSDPIGDDKEEQDIYFYDDRY